MIHEPLIIVVGVYPEVVRLLSEALVGAGYAVSPITDAAAAERLMRAHPVAGVITSPYVPQPTRMSLAKAARRAGAKVIMLHTGEISQTELADAVVCATAAAVVEAMQELLPDARRQSA